MKLLIMKNQTDKKKEQSASAVFSWWTRQHLWPWKKYDYKGYYKLIIEQTNNTINMAFVPPNTIEDSLANNIILAHTTNIIVDVSNVSQRIAAEVFNNNFTTFLDIKFSELEDS